MTGPLKPAIRVVALVTRLLTITIGAISLVTRLPTSVDKMMSSITGPLALVAVRHLQPSNRQHKSPMRHLRLLN